jgi:hypothetical protein
LSLDPTMSKKAFIKGPPPTTEQVAEKLGLSSKDVMRTREWARQILAKKGFSPASSKKAAAGKGVRSDSAKGSNGRGSDAADAPSK